MRSSASSTSRRFSRKGENLPLSIAGVIQPNHPMIFVVFMLLAMLTLWASILTLFGFTSGRVRQIYCACLIAAAMAAFWATFRFTRTSSDGNTQLRGWPVPVFISQKQLPNDSWKMIGGSSVLAFPLNYFLFTMIPSLGVLIATAVARFRKLEAQARNLRGQEVQMLPPRSPPRD